MSPPQVLCIEPGHRLVPANLLRVHVRFSVPMRTGTGGQRAFKHVRLETLRGEVVEGAFLEKEIWSPDGRRWTLPLTPDRQRLGWVPGKARPQPVLREGEVYRLRIRAGLLSADGEPLAEDRVLPLRVGGVQRAPVDPGCWKQVLPTPGTREPVILAFPVPLDAVQLRQGLKVMDDAGERVPGEVVVSTGGACWAFTPEAPWADAPHHLEVHRLVDDGCGNSVGRAQDGDLRLDLAIGCRVAESTHVEAEPVASR